jgi:hypothetical protein
MYHLLCFTLLLRTWNVRVVEMVVGRRQTDVWRVQFWGECMLRLRWWDWSTAFRKLSHNYRSVDELYIVRMQVLLCILKTRHLYKLLRYSTVLLSHYFVNFSRFETHVLGTCCETLNITLRIIADKFSVFIEVVWRVLAVLLTCFKRQLRYCSRIFHSEFWDSERLIGRKLIVCLTVKVLRYLQKFDSIAVSMRLL